MNKNKHPRLVPTDARCKICGRGPHKGERFGRWLRNWNKETLLCSNCHLKYYNAFEKDKKTYGGEKMGRIRNCATWIRDRIMRRRK